MCNNLELVVLSILVIFFIFCIANTNNDSYFGSGPDVFNPDDTVYPYNLNNYDNRQEPVYYKATLPTLD